MANALVYKREPLGAVSRDCCSISSTPADQERNFRMLRQELLGDA